VRASDSARIRKAHFRASEATRRRFHPGRPPSSKALVPPTASSCSASLNAVGILDDFNASVQFENRKLAMARSSGLNGLQRERAVPAHRGATCSVVGYRTYAAASVDGVAPWRSG